MSDALLTRIAEAVEGLRADLKGKPAAAAAPAAKPAAAAAAPAAKPTAAAAKPAAAAAKPAAPKAAAAAKAPGGKYDAEQVKAIVLKVAGTDGLGKEEAKNILKEEANGVSRISDVTAQYFDAVYEACQVALAGVGKPATAAPAAEEFDPLD
jgi:hypothetical protein